MDLYIWTSIVNFQASIANSEKYFSAREAQPDEPYEQVLSHHVAFTLPSE